MNLIEFAEKMHIPVEQAKSSLWHDLSIRTNFPQLSFPPELELLIQEKYFSPQPESVPAEESSDEEPSDSEHYITDAAKFIRRCTRKKYLFLVDTCSIMHNQRKTYLFPEFIKKVKPVLTETHMQIIVPFVVYKEVEWLSKYSNNPDKKIPASHMLPILEQLLEQESDILTMVGDRNDWARDKDRPFADPFFHTQITRFREQKRNTLLITQDNNLTADILSENNKLSIRSKAVIEVRRIGRNGDLFLNNTVVDVQKFQQEGVLCFRPKYIRNNGIING